MEETAFIRRMVELVECDGIRVMFIDRTELCLNIRYDLYAI